jgi:hypothetical protein
MPTEKPKRPFGVSVIVLLTCASVLVTLFKFLALPNIPDIPFLSELGLYAAYTPFSVVNALLIPFQLVLAFGLWYLKRWAWVLYMLQLGISMVAGLQAHFSSDTDADYLVMAVNVLVVFYLNQRDVQLAFGYNAQQREENPA